MSKKRQPRTTDRQVEHLLNRRLIVQTLVALGVVLAILVGYLVSTPLRPEPDPYHTVIITPNTVDLALGAKSSELGTTRAASDTSTIPKMQMGRAAAVLGPPKMNTGAASGTPTMRKTYYQQRTLKTQGR